MTKSKCDILASKRYKRKRSVKPKLDLSKLCTVNDKGRVKLAKDIKLKELAQEAKILEVYERCILGEIVKPQHRWKCPFCGGSHYYLSRRNYLCQDCDACGDAVSYVMETQQESLENALYLLYNRLSEVG
jgi:hypothetical protein